MAPRDKKPNKSSDDDDLQRKKKQSFFKQRFPGFKKKATELSVLCGNSVAFICYGPDNDLHVWPQPHDHNPQTLTQIVSKFNGLSDNKRKRNACDLYDFPNLKDLSGDDLRNHLVNLDSHLVGIKQHKISIMKRNLKKPKEKETEDDHVKVSDNATISNCKVASSEDGLGFGDELGYVFRGSQETVSNIGFSTASNKVSRDVCVSDSSLLDPFTLGFSGHDYLLADPMAVTDNLGVCANNGVWDPSWLDFDFSSTLFTDDWTVSGYNPLLAATDSFTYQTPVTDNLVFVF
ncbi:Transcription factor MADS-box [Arabidopsis thaliana x Arabidopsis arenosa]|uniref:Transcription factor MADS-box n=1 Tax=Arabidopsis thaliana x Arabidopsis arenosa TaxID=1240361 RepID=A0A8T2BJE7_9BRAS|nr:Transcription factor MADS-box [Arabidopsis thaliana x Arabidopsis arenosa]